MMHPTLGCLTLYLTLCACASGLAEDIKVTESEDEVSLETSVLKPQEGLRHRSRSPVAG